MTTPYPLAAADLAFSVALISVLGPAVENVWRAVIMDVARGQTTEMQAARPRFLSAFDKRLSLLKSTHEMATWLRKLGRAEVPDPAVLLAEIARMERLKTSVLDNWQPPDDLEDLAARDYPLTTTDLDRIGSDRRPPASYYSLGSLALV